MKKTVIMIILAALATLICGIENDRNFPAITVTGRSIIINKADNAKVFFSIQAESSTLQNSVVEAKRELTAISKKLEVLGLTEKDISTSQFKSTEGYKFIFGLKKYSVLIDAEIKVNDLTQLENVIFTLAGSKIKEISSIEFMLSNESEVFQQSQLDAVKSAKNKAELLAKELGVTIDGIYSVNQLSTQKISADFNFSRSYKKIKPNPYNSISKGSMQSESVFSGEIKIIAEYEVVFKAVNP